MGKLLAFDLLGGIKSVIEGIFGWVFDIIGNIIGFVIKAIIVLIMEIISNVFSVIFFNISTFILSLLDFIEMIFRLLAGLGVENSDGSITRLVIGGGTSDQGADLLIQLIRNDAIQQAFLAMCIVGIFLLVMTTVFQMIKVEYTTEGAKNAKGPILEKAFKGLANLMLIPILCIFGVFIGNQVLGLLDTATRGTGDSPSMGGALFVAATGDAHYRDDQIRLFIPAPPSVDAASGVAASAMGVSACMPYILAYSLYETGLVLAGDLGIDSSGDGNSSVSDSMFGDDSLVEGLQDAVLGDLNYDTIDNNFITGIPGYQYYDITSVSRFYNFTEISYVLLIVGGCICIKCLYNVCFGMILRLYYCTALFVLSPVVIGMSPVTDNMGKWRTAFIGKAISAYGVVISMNLFFTIIRVLLSIDIEFGSFWGYSFGADMAVGIIKGIIVMGGCLMIEKWSKEFGAYFGAEDALSTGAAFAKETGELTKKAVTTAVVATAAVAAGVMTAGAGSGAVAGIAGKIGALGGKMATKGAAMKGAGGLKGAAGGLLEKAGNSKLAHGVETLGNNIQTKVASTRFGKEHWVNEAAEAVGNSKREKIGRIEGFIDKDKTRITELDNRSLEIMSQFERSTDPTEQSRLSDEQRRIDAEKDKLSKRISTNTSRLEAENTAFADWQKTDEGKEDARSREARRRNADERMVARGAFGKAIGGLAKRNGMIGSIMGGFTDARKEWEGYEKDGSSASDEGVAAYESIMADRKKHKSDAWDKRNKSEIDAKNTIQNQIMNDAILEAMAAQKSEMRATGEKLNEQLKAVEKAIGNLRKEGDTAQIGNHTYTYGDLQTLRAQRGSIINKMDEAGIKEVNGKIDVDIKGASAIEAVMKKAIAGAWDQKKTIAELTRVFEEQGAAGNKKLLDEILKAIEKVKSSTGK